MYRTDLAGWDDNLKQALNQIVPAVVEPTTDALITYFDKNGIQVWRRAKPVLERFVDKHGDEMAEGVKPALTRMLDRQRKSYGRKNWHPKYGQYAPVALVGGSALFLGSLGTGYRALQVLKEKDAKDAGPWLAGAYAMHLGGLALVLAGALLYAGNKLFPKE